MCYATRIIRKAEQIEAYYNIEKLLGKMDPNEELIFNHANGFAHPNMWIIPQEKRQNMIPVMWGLIPSWESGENHQEYYKKTIGYGSGLNAQSEKLFSSTMYKSSALKRRCVVPVDGFFEPHTTPEKVSGRAFKVPFYFERQDKQIMSLAGIYTVTKDDWVTFSILTRPATPLFSRVHNTKKRRPVILQQPDIDIWLSENLTEHDIINVIDNDMPDGEINTYPISRDLYSPKTNSDREDIVEHVKYEEVKIDY